MNVLCTEYIIQTLVFMSAVQSMKGGDICQFSDQQYEQNDSEK